jgi:subtilisin family serine protease
MSGTRATAAVSVVLAAVALAGAAGRGGIGGTELAVGYASRAGLTHALARSHATLVRDLGSLHVAQVRGDVRTLRAQPGIRFVEPVALRASEAEPAATYAPAAAAEWQLRATHTDLVPDAVLRAASKVEIAVIDTGADIAAPDIAAKTPVAWNTRTGSSDVRDPNGHGTFVASLAAGSVTNGDGMSGSGGDARLMIVKSGSDGGSFSDVDEAAGIAWAIDHGAQIINLSVGGPTTSVTERRAVQYAVDHGALVVAAVGNEYEAGNPVEYPAALLQPFSSGGVGGAGLAVTASTLDGRRAPFANTGSWISLAAPGDHILGAVSSASSALTYPRSTLTGARSGLYGYGSGTSFAAPQVAGAAALVWGANPALTAQQVAQILKESASGGGRWTPDLGFGVIDVAAAVSRAQQGLQGVGVLLSGQRVKSRVKLNWSGPTSAYALTLTTDGRIVRTLIPSTAQVTATVALAKGHSYAFTVSALDSAGATTATSSPATFVVR